MFLTGFYRILAYVSLTNVQECRVFKFKPTNEMWYSNISNLRKRRSVLALQSFQVHFSPKHSTELGIQTFRPIRIRLSTLSRSFLSQFAISALSPCSIFACLLEGLFERHYGCSCLNTGIWLRVLNFSGHYWYKLSFSAAFYSSKIIKSHKPLRIRGAPEQ